MLSAAIYFGFAYRFDNRLVLSLALSALGGAFGLSVTKWGLIGRNELVASAVTFSALVGGGGFLLQRLRIKAHFFDTYLHLAALTSLVALLTGYWHPGYLLALLLLCGAVAWLGVRRRSPWLVSYALVTAYLGISIRLIDTVGDLTLTLLYILVSGVMMLVALVVIARQIGREP